MTALAIHVSDEVLPGAAMMGCAWRVKFPSTTFVCKKGRRHAIQVFFSAPTKFVPLSDQIALCVPQRAMNRAVSMTQELVFRDGKISRCTALVVRQMKRNPHLFQCFCEPERKAVQINPHPYDQKVVAYIRDLRQVNRT